MTALEVLCASALALADMYEDALMSPTEVCEALVQSACDYLTASAEEHACGGPQSTKWDTYGDEWA